MTSFFKKIKSRSNSGSYHPDEDESYERVNTHDAQAPPSSYRDPVQSPQLEHQQSDSRMYSSRSSQDGYNQRPMTTRDSGFVDSNNNAPQYNMPASSTPAKPLSAPDLLTAAFNAAIKPYADEIEGHKAHIAQLQQELAAVAHERSLFMNWIDKRGLRADVPNEIANIIDRSDDAASLLYSQLDRKITIVNFDLHRLQDDMNDSISSSHFANTMAKFIPDIRRMAKLPEGCHYAFETVVKLIGNLTQHGGQESPDTMSREEITENQHARQQFFHKMDMELLDIIERRVDQRDTWEPQKELKRLEKNETFLKEMGLGPYFPDSIGRLREIVEQGGHGGKAYSNGDFNNNNQNRY